MTATRSERFDPGIKSLRGHAARGTLINSAFQIGLAGLGAVQRIAVAGFLTVAEFGLWGVVLTILVTLAWLKNVGINDKYIQQDEPDQELAFQRAFTLELLISGLYFVLVLLVVPLYVLLYGTADLVVPVIVLALIVPITAFQSPEWIAYRRLQYLRQRILTAINPVVAFVVTIALGIAGVGYWCVIVGYLAGAVAGATACLITSPYPIRLRFDRATLRNYAGFSWPLLAGGISQLIIVQGALIAASRTEGIAAVGSIGLAVSIVIFADRVDTIVSHTIYPAVCAVADRLDLLREAFIKTNRIALMWAIPFSTAVALFAHDLTRYVLGERWVVAASLMAALALSSGFGQVGFNWGVFMRAVDRTRPLFTAAVVNLVVFLVVALPAIILFGLTGYAVGVWSMMLAQLIVRNHYVTRLFPGFSMVRQLLRAIVPTVPAAAIVLASRFLVPEGRSPGRAAIEFVAFAAVAIGCSYLWEGRLIREMAGYLRRGRRTKLAPAT